MTTCTDTDSGKTLTAHNLEDAITVFSANASAGPVHPATETNGTTIWCATIYHKRTMRKIGQFTWARPETEATA